MSALFGRIGCSKRLLLEEAAAGHPPSLGHGVVGRPDSGNVCRLVVVTMREPNGTLHKSCGRGKKWRMFDNFVPELFIA